MHGVSDQNSLPNRPPIWLRLIRESFLKNTASSLQVLLGPVHARSGTVLRTAASNDPENNFESCFQKFQGLPQEWPLGVSRLSKAIVKLDRQMRTGMATAVTVRQHQLLYTVRRPGSLSHIA